MSQERSVDIDTEIDFKLASAILAGGGLQPNLNSQRLSVRVMPHFHEEVRVA